MSTVDDKLQRMREAEALIRAAQHVFVATHIDPDGDAIGSLLGMGWALRNMGKRVTLACADPVPTEFNFLPGSQGIGPYRPTHEDLVISLDAGDLSRLGSTYDPSAAPSIPLLVIDHHATNTGFGTVNVIDPPAAATGQLIFDLLSDMGAPIDVNTATCLLTGLVTDTRGFRTSSTTPRVLEVAQRLMEAGANLAHITHHVFDSKPLSTLRIMGRVLSEAQLEDRVIWVSISKEMLRQCGATPGDTSNLANLLSSTREADVAVVFREKENGLIDVSLRSAPGVDVAGVALRLGGGGHTQAAGATVPGSLEEVVARTLLEVKLSLNGRTAEQSEGRDVLGLNST